MSVKMPGELALSPEACTHRKPAVNAGIRSGYTTRIISPAQAASTSLTLTCMAQHRRTAVLTIQARLRDGTSSGSGNGTSNNVAAVVVAAAGLQVPAKLARGPCPASDRTLCSLFVFSAGPGRMAVVSTRTTSAPQASHPSGQACLRP